MSDNAKDPRDYGAVLNIAKFMKNAISSAAEAEIGALFLNSRHTISARTTLIEMGHSQPSTLIQEDNTTAFGFGGKNLTLKATKPTDMQFWSMRDRPDQKQFRYYRGR